MVTVPPSSVILAVYLLIRLAGLGLTVLNLRHQAAHGHEVPPGFEGEVDPALLVRIRDYTLASGRLGLGLTAFDLILTLLFVFGGLLGHYNSWLAGQNWPPVLTGVLFFLLLLHGQTLLHLPFALIRTFGIEKQYGFTTQSPRLWAIDLLKRLLLGTVLTSLLLAGSLTLILFLPVFWWLAVWLLFLLFSVFLLYLFPTVIEPLFNTFTPIADEKLADRIRELLARAGIAVRKILVMDASRRSRHSNAYFGGIGRVKRIVLFDTLLRTSTPEEVVAIVAHEAGHWKKKHLLKRLLIMEIITLAGCYLAYRLMTGEQLGEWFPMEQPTLAAKLFLTGFLASLLASPLQPLTSYFSRQHEREADDFAVRLTGTPSPLRHALIRLGRDNLTGLHPHPWYAAFHYSHPPLPQRIKRLRTRP